MNTKRIIRLVLVVVIGVATWYANDQGLLNQGTSTPTTPSQTQNPTGATPGTAGGGVTSSPNTGGEAALLKAYRDRQSGVMIECTGTIDRLLRDDNEGSRHQKFILRLPGRHTVLVSHNIDLAERIPASQGDRIEIRGQYEWNDRGGVLHWTHHDPRGRRPGGWIKHGGKTYR